MKAKESKILRRSKITVAIANFVLLIYGVSLAAVAIWIRNDPLTQDLGPRLSSTLWQADDDGQDDESRPHVSFLRMLTVLTVVSGFLAIMFCLIAAFGMIYYSARCYGSVYLILLVFGLAAALVMFIEGFPSTWIEITRKQWGGLFMAEYMLETPIRDMGSAYNFTEVFNNFQITERCCGLGSYTDYKLYVPERLPNVTISNNTFPHIVPQVCCRENLNEHERNMCMMTANETFTYLEGCGPAIMRRANMYYFILLGLVLFSIILEVLCVGLIIRLCLSQPQ